MFFKRSGGTASPNAPEAANREKVLSEMEAAFEGHGGFVITRGTDTDLDIKNDLGSANWKVGQKKVEFSACLSLRDSDHTVVYWEMVKETSSGFGLFASFKVESHSTFGKTRAGSVKETTVGPAGAVIDYTWNYAETRNVLQGIAERNGWKFATVLRRGSATKR